MWTTNAFLINSTNKLNDKQAMVKALEWQEQHPIFALAPTD